MLEPAASPGVPPGTHSPTASPRAPAAGTSHATVDAGSIMHHLPPSTGFNPSTQPIQPLPHPLGSRHVGTHGEVPHAAQGGGLLTAGGLQQGSPITPPRGQQPRCPHTAPSLTRAGGPAPVDASTQGTHCCLPPTPWPRWGEHRPSPPCPSPGTCVSNVAGSSRESACSESSTKFLSNRVMGPSSLRGAGQGEGTLGPSRTGLEAGGIPD